MKFVATKKVCCFCYYYFLFVCKFRPQESQSDVLGDLRRMISLVVGPYFDMPPLLLPGLEPATPGTPTVLTRVRCLSLKPDMDREVRSHPDSRISAKVQSWELGLSRVLRPDDHRNHPELRHVSSLHYRLRHQSCQCATSPVNCATSPVDCATSPVFPALACSSRICFCSGNCSWF